MVDDVELDTADVTGLPVEADTTYHTPPKVAKSSPRVVLGAESLMSLMNQYRGCPL